MTTPDDTSDDNAALSPERMLSLVHRQQHQITARTAAFVPWMLLAWGVAWLAGFLVLWADACQHPDDPLPTLGAGVTFAALLIAAGVLSTVLGALSGRGLRGTREAAFVGIVYGNTWWVGGIALFVIGQALAAHGMSDALLVVFYPSVFIFFSGIMYLMAGIIWHAVPMLVLGIWSVIVAAVGASLQHPTAFLVYAIAGGGAFLVVAAWSAWWRHGARRSLAQVGDDCA
ncbi:hypothetical protein JF531_14290 [Microbacterium esteraromaticum]|uniref:hypothetical protein n=1 Tax=Microbacterium esteraromaticum TaxID=57043 RepID=UPI0015C9BC4F|nr:hypothetical protein [Microbacterium esteraromaticum]MBN8425688.1 hypothetical protein [Microbacterium esteraromaticum]